MRRYLVILPMLVLAGCVSATKFKDQRSRADVAERRAAALDQELASSRAQADEAAKKAAAAEADLRAQLQAGAEQLASLQKSNQDLQESLEAKKGELTRKIGDLVKDKDEAARKLAASAKDLSAAQARMATVEAALARAEAEKAALEKAKEEELAKVKKNYEDLAADLKSEIAAGEVTTTQLKGKLTVNMVDRILFDSGQAEVRADGKKVLEKVGKVLASVSDKDIRIEGHTDNKPIVGELKNRYPTNWELSTARATAVLRYLQEHARVDSSRLVAAGYGEQRPVAPNDTAENRALNRRIEIVLVPRE